ncbi:MAG: glycosyltransferase family 4 protein [Oscillochloridaceae bacterium umkhey_bin13]
MMWHTNPNITSNQQVLFCHPGVPPFAQQAARALYEADLLAQYVTTFAYQPSSRLGRMLRLALRPVFRDPERELQRRIITEIPEALVQTYPWPELVHMAVVRLSIHRVIESYVWEFAERWFSRYVANQRLDNLRAVYCYQHAALEPFLAAKQQGVKCLYDQPIAHHQTLKTLIEHELALFPQLLTTTDRHLHTQVSRRNAQTDEELLLADCIFTGSSFTKQSLIEHGVNPTRVTVMPLGAPPVVAQVKPRSQQPVIILCAGTQSVRKGVHYLLDAWRRLRPGSGAELWLVGRMQLPEALLADLPGTVVIKPSVPRSELYELYERASVLVFPSLAEGFGQVITESMAHGLPVITTPNTAGPDLITNGVDGMIVPIRNADALAEALTWALEHPVELAAMGHAAWRTAQAHQWSAYRSKLATEVMQQLVADPANV